MFQIGDQVVCGSKGVCVVENITTLDLPGVDHSREYYILKPVYSNSSTVYVPVDSGKEVIRKVITVDDVKALICEIPSIPVLTAESDKLLEQRYKECLRTCECRDLVRILKTIYKRRQERLAMGRKETAVDAKYFHLAEEQLYGELALVLQLPRTGVEEHIVQAMQEV